MSDEECGGLSITKEAFECPKWGEIRESDIDLTRHIATSHSDKVLVPEKIELVRRSDVKKLIKDKIEELHQLNRAYQDEYRPIPYSVSENVEQIKEELLEELEGEASE